MEHAHSEDTDDNETVIEMRLCWRLLILMRLLMFVITSNSSLLINYEN